MYINRLGESDYPVKSKSSLGFYFYFNCCDQSVTVVVNYMNDLSYKQMNPPMMEK